MKPLNRTYIHFADYYHSARARSNLTGEAHLRRAISTAFRMCLLFSQDVILPASSVFESPEAQLLLKEYDPFRTHGAIKMAAGDASVLDHLESKLGAYDSSSSKHFLDAYHRKQRVLPPYIVRPGSSTRTIGRSWLQALEDRKFLKGIRGAFGGPLPLSFEKEWASIPDDLGQKAFVDVHASDLLEHKGIAIPKLKSLLPPIIEEPYISGYKTSLDAWLMTGIPYLAHPPIEARLNGGKLVDYTTLAAGLSRFGLLDRILRAKVSHLFALWCRQEWDVLASSIISSSPVVEESARIAMELATFLDSLASAKDDQLEIELLLPMNSIMPKATRQKFDAAVIVALPIETAAMLTLLADDKPVHIDGDPNQYYAGTLILPDKKPHSVLVCQLHRMGTNAAATSTTNMMRSFEVEQAIVCGIALGIPQPGDVSKHVRLGDVVVSDRAGVIQTDHRSLKNSVETSRSLMQPPPAPLVRVINAIETDLLRGRQPSWDDLIDKVGKDKPRFKRPDAGTDVIHTKDGKSVPHPEDPERDVAHPKFVRAVFGSSNTLVKDEDFRDKQADVHGVQAMEMEGAGVLEALWAFEGSAMVVKGVCDYGVKKDNRWHAYAALAAAAVTAYIIAEL